MSSSFKPQNQQIAPIYHESVFVGQNGHPSTFQSAEVNQTYEALDQMLNQTGPTGQAADFTLPDPGNTDPKSNGGATPNNLDRDDSVIPSQLQDSQMPKPVPETNQPDALDNFVENVEDSKAEIEAQS
jgi:hypothetical protein